MDKKFTVNWKRKIYPNKGTIKLGFIILRHINSKRTDRYWKLCYQSIRRFYPNNRILIIDDNSDESFIDKDYKTINTKIINSEYPRKRGELLPYIYYLKEHHSDIAVILHDTTILNKFIQFQTDTYQFLWEFKINQHQYCLRNNRIIELELVNALNNNAEIKKEYIKNDTGCFGGMTVINYSFLKKINEIHNLNNLIKVIDSRAKRMAFERVIAAIFRLYQKTASLLGDIHLYCPWGITYEYIAKKTVANSLPSLNLHNKWNKKILYEKPIMKYWCGR